MPAYFARIPTLEGRVVDARDNPVAAATVIVRSVNPPKEIARLQTGADGRFYRGDEGSWGLFIPMEEYMVLAYQLQAASGAMTSEEKDFRGNWVKPLGLGTAVQNFGDIPLH